MQPSYEQVSITLQATTTVAQGRLQATSRGYVGLGLWPAKSSVPSGIHPRSFSFFCIFFCFFFVHGRQCCRDGDFYPCYAAAEPRCYCFCCRCPDALIPRCSLQRLADDSVAKSCTVVRRRHSTYPVAAAEQQPLPSQPHLCARSRLCCPARPDVIKPPPPKPQQRTTDAEPASAPLGGGSVVSCGIVWHRPTP